ncbi:MAG: hypothetical protein ACI87E_003812 [Mariniblastus sp.]|jgi:hypothetical protein
MSNTHSHPQSDSKPPLKPTPVNEELDDEESGSRFLMFNVMPSWMVSFLTHIAIIVVLAIMVMPKAEERSVALEAGQPAADPMEDPDSMDFETLDFQDDNPLDSEMSMDFSSDVAEEIEPTLLEVNSEVGNLMGAMDPLEVELAGELSPSDMSAETSSRSGRSKSRSLREYGGTPASEESVALALKWIIKHQLPDGGWSMDHTLGPGDFRTSSNPGSIPQARGGATALALLPLLGAGHTHQTGEYKEQVKRGLEYLISRGKRGQKGVSFLEPGGSMYSHGLVAIVFCEAYGMTKDPVLLPYAQGTLWFIEYAQDPIGGGWRYRPREPGDTSVVGWQLMALKSGKISGLNVNPQTYKLVEKFLDSVSTSAGAYYGYAAPPRGMPANACSAVGLLCRMYLGWGKSVPGMVDGVANLADRGPSVNLGDGIDMYYNYYATQTMKHIGGRQWVDWNNIMRNFLVASQETEGNEAGSWHFNDGHASVKGGRLYSTSLACMTLEVYYRYLPLYGAAAANDEFPLD